MLEYQQDDRDGLVVLALKGNLDALTARELKPTIDELVSSKKTRIICDLQQLRLIDSSGVGAIVSLFKQVRMLGGDVKIAGLADQPKEIFRLLRLDRAFELYETVQDAEQAFAPKGP